jgi:hypothetical protein
MLSRLMVMAKHRSSKWGPTLLAARKLILAQGEVIYAFNLLHDRFFRLFNIALSLERPDKFGAHIRFYDHALAIWHVVLSDNQQRKMALVAISTVPTKLKLQPAIKRLEWARTKADKLAEYRNIIAHNTIMFRGIDVKGNRIISVPAFGSDITRPIHRARLKEIKFGFWAILRTDILVLSDYVEALNQQILRIDSEAANAELVGVPKTWPDKPRLRSLRLIRLLEQSQPKVSATKRRARQRSSHGSP